MIYFEKDYLRIDYDQEENLITMNWKEAVVSEEFREGLNKGLECVEEHSIKHWLADVREMGALSNDDQEWSNNEWFPKIIKAGIKFMGVVISSDIFNQMTVDEIMTKVPQTDIVHRNFDNMDKAKEWLLSQKA